MTTAVRSQKGRRTTVAAARRRLSDAAPLTEAQRRKGLRQLQGKYAHAFPSVDDYLRLKRADVEAGKD